MGQFRYQALIAIFLLFSFVGISLYTHAQARSSIMLELGPHFGELVVANHGPTVLLHSTVVIEQKVDGQWQKIPVSNLELREACLPSPSPKCIKLRVNTTFHPVPWTGNFCSSQCPASCRLDGLVPPGTYRFVITSCYGEQVYLSPPFIKK